MKRSYMLITATVMVTLSGITRVYAAFTRVAVAISKYRVNLSDIPVIINTIGK
jgi:hypothetical protein